MSTKDFIIRLLWSPAVIIIIVFIISLLVIWRYPMTKKHLTRIRCKLACNNTVYDCCSLRYCFKHCNHYCYRMNFWKNAISEMNFGGHKFFPRYLGDKTEYAVMGICDNCGFQIKSDVAERDASFKQLLDTCKMVETRKVIES